jgi:hypothetical protein
LKSLFVTFKSSIIFGLFYSRWKNIGFAGPDLNNHSGPNQDALFEFLEFTTTRKNTGEILQESAFSLSK